MPTNLETLVHIAAPATAVFARLDDQTRLGAHMERPSPMMGGGRMTFEFDGRRGQAIGSHIKMGGSAFGISLYVDEVVTEREPPRRKAWETVGHPRLLVVGAYRMGFDITPVAGGSDLRVWIAYNLPPGLLGRWLGPFLAPFYAKWCVGQMARDAATYFAQSHSL
ncbi:SRPBCC family protein [soil metagenome]